MASNSRSSASKRGSALLSMPCAPLLKRMYGDGTDPIYSDIELFVMGGEDGTEILGSFKAHKNVLAASSPFFEQLLCFERWEGGEDQSEGDENQKEGSEDGPEGSEDQTERGEAQKEGGEDQKKQDAGKVKLSDECVSVDGLAAVLKVIYGHEIVLSDDSVQSIHCTANFLQLEYITVKCARYMTERVCAENVIEWLQYANQSFAGSFDVLASCFEVLRAKFSELAANSAFLPLKCNEMRMIVNSIQLGHGSVSHVELLDICLTWLCHDLPLRHTCADEVLKTISQLNFTSKEAERLESFSELKSRLRQQVTSFEINTNCEKLLSALSDRPSVPLQEAGIANLPEANRNLVNDYDDLDLSLVGMGGKIYFFTKMVDECSVDAEVEYKVESSDVLSPGPSVHVMSLTATLGPFESSVFHLGSIFLISSSVSGSSNLTSESEASLKICITELSKSLQTKRYHAELGHVSCSKTKNVKVIIGKEHICVVIWGREYGELQEILVHSYWFHSGLLVTNLDNRLSLIQINEEFHLKESSMCPAWIISTKLYITFNDPCEDVEVGRTKIKILDLLDFSWSDGPKMPVDIVSAGMTVCRNRLYISGGWMGINRPFLRDVYMHKGCDQKVDDQPTVDNGSIINGRADNATGLVELPKMNAYRMSHLLVACGNNLFALGGMNDDFRQGLHNCEQLDLGDLGSGWSDQPLLHGMRPDFVVSGD